MSGPAGSSNISVIVCTHERPDDLRRCLRALKVQVEPPLEIIVVDNAPRTDATRDVCAASGVRYVREPRQGLDIARNTGLHAAVGDVIAFTDDDAVPAPDWTRWIRLTMASGKVAGMAGAMEPFEIETEAQRLFEAYVERMRSRRRERREFSSPFPAVLAGHVGAGANMAFRREALAAVGDFEEAFDAGTETHSGGDTEMFARLLAGGHTLVYEPHASVRHRHRRTRRELNRQIFGYGVGVFAFLTHWWLRTRDWAVVQTALSMLWWHVTRLPDSLRHRNGELPPGLVMRELAGSFVGPIAYSRSRRRLRHEAARAHV